MPAASSKKKTVQAAIAACGCEREKLRSFAEEIIAGLSEIPAAGDTSPVDIFISELVLSAADQRRRTERRQHQMKCIADAKSRGIHFGPQPAPLPDAFDECHQAWRDGRLSLQQAAESCGMGRTSFRRAVLRKEEGTVRAAQ